MVQNMEIANYFPSYMKTSPAHNGTWWTDTVCTGNWRTYKVCAWWALPCVGLMLGHVCVLCGGGPASIASLTVTDNSAAKIYIPHSDCVTVGAQSFRRTATPGVGGGRGGVT